MYFQSSQYVSMRMSTFQESKEKKIKEDDCTLTRYWIFTQGKWGCRKRAEARIRVGLIVSPTVLSYQYPFLVYFYCTLAQFVSRALFIFSIPANFFRTILLATSQIRHYLYCEPMYTVALFFFFQKTSEKLFWKELLFDKQKISQFLKEVFAETTFLLNNI